MFSAGDTIHSYFGSVRAIELTHFVQVALLSLDEAEISSNIASSCIYNEFSEIKKIS